MPVKISRTWQCNTSIILQRCIIWKAYVFKTGSFGGFMPRWTGQRALFSLWNSICAEHSGFIASHHVGCLQCRQKCVLPLLEVYCGPNQKASPFSEEHCHLLLSQPSAAAEAKTLWWVNWMFWPERRILASLRLCVPSKRLLPEFSSNSIFDFSVIATQFLRICVLKRERLNRAEKHKEKRWVLVTEWEKLSHAHT